MATTIDEIVRTRRAEKMESQLIRDMVPFDIELSKKYRKRSDHLFFMIIPTYVFNINCGFKFQ